MIRLTPQHKNQIAAHGERDYPHECCGLMLGAFTAGSLKTITEIYPISNAREEAAKRNRFLITPEEFMEGEQYAQRNGLDVVGFYHSHPRSDACASATDLAEATYPNHLFLIAGLGPEPAEVRLYRFADGNFHPTPFVTVP